jgi:CheY-like chemotaxis protein
MGGTIGVASTPGEGSTFWFTLPPAAVTPDAVSAAASTPLLPPGPHQGRWHLLYIEDNPVNAVLVEAMLSRDPAARLQIALLPDEGLALAQEAPPDLVLLDIQLPGMDGFEVLRRLRADARTARVPVIAISANAAPGDVERGLAAGFDDYLAKPLELNLLVHTLTRVLEAHRAA